MEMHGRSYASLRMEEVVHTEIVESLYVNHTKCRFSDMAFLFAIMSTRRKVHALYIPGGVCMIDCVTSIRSHIVSSCGSSYNLALPSFMSDSNDLSPDGARAVLTLRSCQVEACIPLWQEC